MSRCYLQSRQRRIALTVPLLLTQKELASFMAGVNPGVRLTPIQMREIVEQVEKSTHKDP